MDFTSVIIELFPTTKGQFFFYAMIVIAVSYLVKRLR